MIGRLVFAATRDTAQSISSGLVPDTANALRWETITLDLLGGWAAGTPNRYRPTIPGWYRCEGAASLAANTTGGIRGIGWMLNGSLPAASGARPQVASAYSSATVTMSARGLPLLFNGSTDYLELAPFQNTGAALDTATGSIRPYIAVYYVGPA
ncbi:hypothetical protein ACPCTG_26505 [Streptomyces pseudogriseolus]|uniref:hypothetical protein n=1 Tax=Streptomyces pseudogriseolus TaxID=36817 RepID=UPI003FA31999